MLKNKYIYLKKNLLLRYKDQFKNFSVEDKYMAENEIHVNKLRLFVTGGHRLKILGACKIDSSLLSEFYYSEDSGSALLNLLYRKGGLMRPINVSMINLNSVRLSPLVVERVLGNPYTMKLRDNCFIGECRYVDVGHN